MRAYLILFSLFKSYKIYVFLHILLLSILMYVFFSLKLFETIYSNFISYKYGFTPDISMTMDKEQNLDEIINAISSKNIKFSYKMGAIKKLKNIHFSEEEYKSLSMDIDLMGLSFNKNIYVDINNNKCLIVDIKNINKNWIFYLDKCEIKNKIISIKTKNGGIPFKVRKKENLYRLKTKNFSDKQNDTLYEYLTSILQEFDDINHIGINFSDKDSKQRALRDYLGLIFNKNPSFIPAIVSKDIYKEISWLKRKHVFVNINMLGYNQKIYVYNEFYNAMNTPILLTRFNPKIFVNDYKKFIYIYTQDDGLVNGLKDKFPNIDIKTKNELLGDNGNNSEIIKSIIRYFEIFIFIIALLISSIHLSKFYKKFQKTLFLAQSFGHKIFIYSIYLFMIVLVSYVISYMFFYYTNELINEYMQNYFYPVISISYFNIGYTAISASIFFIIILILENIEYKGLNHEH